MGFHTKLQAAWESCQSMLCIGLDPDSTRYPTTFDRGHGATYEFAKR